MLGLVLILIGGIMLGWLLGRMLGPRSGWRRRNERGPGREDDEPACDAWQESARRLSMGPTLDELDDEFGPGRLDQDDREDDRDDYDEDDDRPADRPSGDR
jgi:hypothetical protein